MFLVVVLTEEIPDAQTAQAHYDIVKQKLLDLPQITHTAAVQEKLSLE